MTRRPQLTEWKDHHAGETMIVCGCGASAAALVSKPPCPVIGVNDMGRLFDPDYLVILNPQSQFSRDRFAAIETTRPKALFTSVQGLSLPETRVVPVALGERGGVDVSPDGRVPFTRNSPYVALALARFMGARRIGMIGVDFTQHHFFGKTGRHSLTRELASIDREYKRLVAAAAKDGVEIVNLSAESKLRSVPKADLRQFLQNVRPKRRVLHVSLTNCAGAIWNLHSLMTASGRIESRVATASEVTRGVFRDRVYPKDILWRDHAAFRQAIEWADILHFHGFVDAQSPALKGVRNAMRNKPALLQLHSEPAVVAPHFPGRDPTRRTDMPVLIVAQKQARFYPNATPVLNAIAPGAYADQPGASAPASGLPRVVYTPTDLATYRQPPPTCRGKGYRATRQILDRLAARNLITPAYGFDLTPSQLNALTSGASSRIDECVTGGYHLTSLESLAHGLATFAWLDPETRALLCRMTGSKDADLPWVSVPIDNLEARLTEMAQSETAFAEAGDAARAWMQKHWTPQAVIDPIIAVYDQIASQSQPRAPHPKQITTGAIQSVIRGHANPRRSEDFHQVVYLSAPLLAARNSRRDKIVHVLGNGPSLAETNLVQLRKDTVIGVNAAVLLQDKLGRPFDYYCVSDRRFLASDEGRRMAESATGSTRVFAGYCAGILPCDTNINFAQIRPGDTASLDLVKGFHHGCSVVLFAAQLAGWLGAAEVRLHGMECDYNANRFYETASKRPNRKHDSGIYPRIQACAVALVAKLSLGNQQLTIAGPSRLTGSFGATAVPGIKGLPITGPVPVHPNPACVTVA
ncbi:hypothetical protein [Sedimentitalea sp.]|uniref:hypothetical protein n=1 Tax=Sedimentitalea sp. TaxID=2048915 RepID=UPI003297E008